MKDRTRKNPRKDLALSEMQFWIDLAIIYEDALVDVLELKQPDSDAVLAALRLMKSRGRLP